MRIHIKKAMAGAVLLGLAAAPTRAERISYLDPVRIPEIGLHPHSIHRLHAGIAWLKAHALRARPEARPVKEVLVARGGPRMEVFDVLEAFHHQLGGFDGLPEIAGLSLKAEFAPACDPEWSEAPPEPGVPETPTVPEPRGVGLMALGMLGMATLGGWSRHKRASNGRA